MTTATVTDAQIETLRDEAGDLVDYETGSFIRPATKEEARESAEAAESDGGAGVIRVEGRRCFVQP